MQDDKHGLRGAFRLDNAADNQTSLLPVRQGLALELHPLKRDEMTALDKTLARRKRQESESERAQRMSRSAFWRVVAQAGKRAGLPGDRFRL